ncbi:MAG: hypothetical protein JW720_03220 [Sedimentisphaerales bacterium]|nr:hypothetical protein [Sedimentisphaerales bacterium]
MTDSHLYDNPTGEHGEPGVGNLYSPRRRYWGRLEASKVAVLFLCLFMSACGLSGAEAGLTIQNGWFVHNDKVVWGYAQHNGWWGGYRKAPGWFHNYKVRTAICRNAPGRTGPSFTEDLDKLTDAMLSYGYPGFEHNYGLWYDRRRDTHDTVKRTDKNVVPPFLEQPWARSGQASAWDGLSKYDLTKFNSWYFDRLNEFARYCDAKGTILFHNFYMQHALLETPAHYVDFPWRGANCIQDTQMPDAIPAANAFYDVTNSTRRRLHSIYIRKCLDELGPQSNVIHLISEEYTGGLAFMRFWMDTVLQWKRDNGKNVKIGITGTKDVIDAILEDPARGPEVCAVCLSYWWYNADGTLYAPPGGKEIAGRYTGNLAKQTTPQSLYRQIREYRLRYPDKAIVQHHPAEIEKAWAFLMGGGSMIIAGMQYADSQPPKNPWDPPDSYIAPPEAAALLPTYEFINANLSKSLQKMRPADIVPKNKENNWSLSGEDEYLIFALKGGRIDLDLSSVAKTPFVAKWFNPRNGALTPAGPGSIIAGRQTSFEAPDDNCWVLWLKR